MLGPSHPDTKVRCTVSYLIVAGGGGGGGAVTKLVPNLPTRGLRHHLHITDLHIHGSGKRNMEMFDAIGALKEARLAAEARASKVERSPETAPTPAHVFKRLPPASLQGAYLASDGSLEARADNLLENLLAARLNAAADHQTRAPYQLLQESPARTKAIAEADAAAELRAAEKARLFAETQAAEEARLENPVCIQQDWLAEEVDSLPIWERTPLTKATLWEDETQTYVYVSHANATTPTALRSNETALRGRRKTVSERSSEINSETHSSEKNSDTED